MQGFPVWQVIPIEQACVNQVKTKTGIDFRKCNWAIQIAFPFPLNIPKSVIHLEIVFKLLWTSLIFIKYKKEILLVFEVN